MVTGKSNSEQNILGILLKKMSNIENIIIINWCTCRIYIMIDL